MNDRELIRLLRKNPAKGFDMMTKTYGGLLYAVVRGRLSVEHFGSAQVEDVVADTFSDFYLSLSSFAPDRCSIKSYLCVMARNKATDILRKNRIVQLPLEDAEDVLIVSDTIGDSELRSQVLDAVKALGEPDSIILIRKYYLGQPTKEIASSLDLSPSNVDTRTHRAIEKLRKRFGGTT